MTKNQELLKIGEQNASKQTIRLAGLLHDSITDGPGLRFVVFTQGCPHHCKECHNPETWNYNGGKMYSAQEILESLKKNPLTKGVTFSGGDPMEQAGELVYLAHEMKNAGYEVACYTGYLFEDLLKDESEKAFLQEIDVLVDGPFVLKEKSLGLKFKGSRNQRVINVKKSLKQGKVVLEKDERWV